MVVKDEQVGKDLLESPRLTKRVTIIPLNRVSPRAIPEDKLRAARRGSHLALELVGYAPQVDAAMRFVFGSTLVCDGSN